MKEKVSEVIMALPRLVLFVEIYSIMYLIYSFALSFL